MEGSQYIKEESRAIASYFWKWLYKLRYNKPASKLFCKNALYKTLEYLDGLPCNSHPKSLTLFASKCKMHIDANSTSGGYHSVTRCI
jgi:hypothetical protein